MKYQQRTTHGKSNKRSLRAFTLVEVMVVAGILSFIMGATMMILLSSNRAWHTGQERMTEQRQARAALDTIANFLRRSNPAWTAACTASSSEENTRIDFYVPYFYSDCCPNQCSDNGECQDTDGVYHSRGDIAGLSKVTFKLLGQTGKPGRYEMWMNEGEGITNVRRVASDIVSLGFTAGCSGSTAGSAVSADCSYVDVSVATEVKSRFTLQSKIAMRNQNITVAADIPVQEPEEGEF